MPAPGWARYLGRLYAVWAVLAAGHTLLLAFDGRYRDFPNELFALPLLATLVFVAARYALGRAHGRAGLAIDGLFGPGSGPAVAGDHRAILFGASIMAAIGMVIGETLANREALIWAGMAVLIAIPMAFGMRLPARPARPA